MKDTPTDVIAAAALSSPAWLPWLEQASKVAGLVVPILGAIWLVVRIWRALFRGGD